jgi:hypothetical protein
MIVETLVAADAATAGQRPDGISVHDPVQGPQLGVARTRLKEINEALNSTCSSGRVGRRWATTPPGDDKPRHSLNRSLMRIPSASGSSCGRVSAALLALPRLPVPRSS